MQQLEPDHGWAVPWLWCGSGRDQGGQTPVPAARVGTWVTGLCVSIVPAARVELWVWVPATGETGILRQLLGRLV